MRLYPLEVGDKTTLMWHGILHEIHILRTFFYQIIQLLVCWMHHFMACCDRCLCVLFQLLYSHSCIRADVVFHCVWSVLNVTCRPLHLCARLHLSSLHKLGKPGHCHPLCAQRSAFSLCQPHLVSYLLSHCRYGS